MYRMLDYILNRSNTAELEVIQKAIQRRLKDLRRGIAGVSVHEMVRDSARSFEDQIASPSSIRSMVRRFITRII